ncbi:MAG TPA: CocE/NonD family hydrolase [Steroidobacteraceae bacterium]|nr:CocE/NonD family hydrolase [Steroidobacteraceae bacterium]
MIDRREFALKFLQLAAALAVPARVFSETVRGALDVVVQRDVMVATRDGVKLATDIYLPAKNGKPLEQRSPVILERTPYGKSGKNRRHASEEIANIYASHGYAVVFQDCRGRGNSQGEYVKYLSDGRDGYDCCAWIVKQPWSNGRIGAQGLSYGAHTITALACLDAPGLAAMFVDSGGFANAYQGGIRQGGAFELKQVTWAFNQALEAPEIRNDPAKRAALQAVDIKGWFGRMPWARGHSPLSLVPEYEDYVFDQWEHGVFDDFWKQVGIYAAGSYDRFSDVPIVWMSSWYDPYPRTATDNYVALGKRKRSPQHLILGPWTHGNNHETFAGDVDFGPTAELAGNIAPDLLTLRMRWFDRWLQGVKNEVDSEPAVRIFVMGGGTGRKNAAGRMDHGGRWRAEKQWPLAGAVPTSFYLHGDGALSQTAPAVDAPPRVYDYDPRHPVPTIGGTVTSGQPVMVGGAFDQREAERADVLVFQTAPLEHDVEVTGAIEAELWIASNCPDTDFTIKLLDVHPPNEDYPHGYAMNLTDGILRCRYRDSWERPALLTPGEIYRIEVTAFPTSNLFKRGHRMRLDVSSSNFPHFDLNLNTGAPEGAGGEVRVATNRVFVDQQRASRVVLPVMRVSGK